MVKRMLLSALFCASTLATAQINLDMNLTISNEVTERTATGAVVVNEDEISSIMFNGLDSLVVDLMTQTNDGIATIKAQFFQTTETEELLAITKEALTVTVPLGETATITVNEQDDSGSLVLVITPTLVE